MTERIIIERADRGFTVQLVRDPMRQADSEVPLTAAQMIGFTKRFNFGNIGEVNDFVLRKFTRAAGFGTTTDDQPTKLIVPNT